MKRVRQVIAFARKEIVDVLRQPRLLLTLVFGPFLIMAAFGIGYRNEPKPLRTLLIAPADDPVLQEVQANADDLGSYVRIVGATEDANAARQRLLDGDVDVLVDLPDQPLETLQRGERAPITIVHTRLDPIERTAISYASALAVDQINAQILSSIVQQGQQQSEPMLAVMDRADAATTALSRAVAADDSRATESASADLRTAVTQVRTASALAQSVLAQTGGTAGGTGSSIEDVTAANADLDAALASLESSLAEGSTDAATVDRVSSDLQRIRSGLSQVLGIQSQVLVRPFVSQVQIAAPEVGDVTDWYAPAGVMLIIQQFGVAFGALTFVREKALGITDVFRVAPIQAGAANVGKYIAYLLLGGAMAAALSALVIGLLDVPVAGSIGDMAIVMALTLFASIGLGFVVSLGSANDAQAVQYTLIILLASLFFSGFFLAIGQMKGPAQVVTWLLPVSYGMSMLRDVMLRGDAPQTHLLLGLGGYGVGMFVLSWLGARRMMSTAGA